MGEFLKVYQIKSVKDRGGSPKEIPMEWYKTYSIYLLEEGCSAILLDVNSDMNLRTSTVEAIQYLNNDIEITTRNTVYTLERVGN